MDGQDHKMSSTSTGHEVHDVHLCYRCGWPFHNPHPSAKHRKAHKRVCGTIEGYKVILSEEHDHHLTGSDGEHTSGDDDEHTPNPKPLKKNGHKFGSSGRVVEKSNKAEDDVFADAATEFGNSGNSLQLQEQVELSGPDNSTEEKRVENDVDGGVSQKAGENADITEPIDDPASSKEISKPGAPVNVMDLSGNVSPVIDDKGEAISVGIARGLQPDDVKSEALIKVVDDITEVGVETEHRETKSQLDIDIEGENKLDSANLNSEEGTISESTSVAAEKKEELRDKLVSESEMVENPETENLKNIEASVGVENVADPVETGSSTKPVNENGIVHGNHENDASVGVKKTNDAAGDIETVEAVGKALAEKSPSSGPYDTAETYDVISSIDKKVEQEASLADKNTNNFDTSERGKCGVDGNEVRNLESEDKFSSGIISTPGSADNNSMVNDDQITMGLMEHENQCEENPYLKSSEAGNEKGGVASQEVQATFDSKMHSENSTDFPRSSVAELSHDDVQNKSFPIATSKDTETSFISELPNQIHVRSNGGTELKDNEQLISKDSTASLTVSELLSGDSAKENSCIDEGVRAEPHESIIVVSNENSERSNASLNDTSHVEDGRTSEDVSTSKVVGIVLGVDQTSDGYVGDDRGIIDVEHAMTGKSLQDVGDDNKLTEPADGVAAALDQSGTSSSISHSLEGKCGSIAETNYKSPDTTSQRHKTTTNEAHPDTLVQSGRERNKATDAATEVETSQNNQHPKSDPLQARSFPSVAIVTNVSENKNKHDEVTTNRGAEKQHSPLKNLLDEVKSPSTKQDPSENQKEGDETKNNGSGQEAPSVEHIDVNKDIEEWNSPARYPIEDKKVKKKGKFYWVPFVCCSSVHRDL